jgi:transcriptional regulator with XRE-family HTH domain
MKWCFPAFRSYRIAGVQTIRLNLHDAMLLSEGYGDDLMREGDCVIISSADNMIMEATVMTPRLGDAIHQARLAGKLTLRQLADQITKDDGTPISPQYLNDIELHHRVPTPHVLRDLARVLQLDADTLLATAGAADVVVREYLASHPEQAEGVIRLFRAAQRQGFEGWERLREIIEKTANRGSGEG